MVVRKSREDWKILGNVFDAHSEDVLFRLAGQGLFSELAGAIALGKEANIFTATPADGDAHVIVKIYRLQNCNFKKMYDYLRQDTRYLNVKPGKRNIVVAWCQREYRNLLMARDVITVPVPLGFRSNVLVMSLIGEPEKGVVARQLKDECPEDAAGFARKVLENIAKLWTAGLVHGDLSAFNILNDKGAPVFIDFSQAMPTTSPGAREMLERDLRNLATFFRKHGVTIDVEAEAKRIVKAGATKA